MVRRLALYLLLSLLALPFLKAQDPAFVQYTADDGLLSNEVYDLVQDTNDILYIACDEGLQYYDGYRIQSIELSSINNEGIVRLAFDNDQNLWAVSITGDILRIQNGKVEKHPMSDAFRSLADYSVYHFFFDENNDIWLNTNINNREYKVTKDSIYQYSCKPELENYYSGHFRKVNQHFSFIKHGYSSQTRTLKACPSNITETDSSFVLKTSFDYNIYIEFATVQQLDSQLYIASIGSKLLIFNKDSVLSETIPFPNHAILDIFIDEQKNIWVSNYAKGISIYRNRKLTDPDRLITSESISEIFMDREKNIWLASLNAGLYYIESKDLLHYHQGFKEPIIDLLSYNQKLYAISHKALFRLDDDAGNFKEIGGSSKGYYFKRMLEVNNDLWLLGKDIYKLNNNEFQVVNEYNSTAYSKDGKGNMAILASSHGLFHYNIHSREFNIIPKTLKGYLKDLCYWNDTLWVGTKEGLKYKKSDEHALQSTSICTSGIKCLNRIPDALLIGTNNHGLIIRSTTQTAIIDSSNSILRSNHIENIYVENEHTIWIISDVNILKLEMDASTPKRLTEYLYQINAQQFKFTSMTKFAGSYWVGTNKGIFKIGKDFTPVKNSNPQIRIENIIASDSLIHTTQDLSLQYDQNDITFNFLSVQFRNHQQLKYFFMLDEVDQSYNTTHATSCTYYNLTPGKHTFRVKALNADGKYTNEAVVHFTIRKHWANTLAFRALVLLIVLSLGYIVFNNWNRKRKRLFAQEQELTKAELKAFRSQMNPHFIFNSMNAIQNLVLLEKTEEAYEYLSQFSVLMRRTLNYSKKHKISLADEIMFVNTYVQIETLRFKNKFTYDFYLDPDLDTSYIQIPPFFLQPLLENAITHGLSPLEKDGKLSLKISSEGPFLRIEIEDNGVGRKRSSELNKIRKDHESTGLENIQERITLLNISEPNKIQFHILDLYNAHNQAIGTQIKLLFPIA